MLRIQTILMIHLREFFKSPGIILLMFIMPIIFSLIFGSIALNAGNNKPVVNIVSGNGAVSSEVIKLLKKNDNYTWKMASKKQANNNVSEQEVVAAVVIPENIVQRMTRHEPVFDVIVERKNEDYLALVPHLQGTAKLLLSSYQIAQQKDIDSYPTLLKVISGGGGIKINKEIVQKNNDQNAAVSLMFIGFAIMFMMFGLSGASSAILDERAEGTWGRLMVTPASRFEVIFGYLLAYFLMGWIQFAVLMAATSLIFGSSWGSLLYVIPFASLVILCVVGFGLMIAGLVKTKPQAAALSAVLIVSTCMLGGVYWSIDIVPEVMRKIALGVPQRWAMAGFEEIISGSLHPKALLQDSLALAGFTAVFFIIGMKRMKFE